MISVHFPENANIYIICADNIMARFDIAEMLKSMTKRHKLSAKDYTKQQCTSALWYQSTDQRGFILNNWPGMFSDFRMAVLTIFSDH